jgi:hypothetical protein
LLGWPWFLAVVVVVVVVVDGDVGGLVWFGLLGWWIAQVGEFV